LIACCAASDRVEILDQPPPGAFGAMIGLQAEWYARHWDFGLPFEAKIAAEAADYAAALPHPDCRSWVALRSGRVVGGITIDGRGRPEARLRWFFVDEPARGGLGTRLLGDAIGFCRDRRFASVWLSTFSGLAAARRLYDRAGFVLEHEAPARSWGVTVREQRLRLHLS
jgi:GNAT superfamily N-acetyltransferase